MAESGIAYKDCRLVIRDESRIQYSDDYNLKALGTVSKDPLIRKTIDRFVHFIDKYGNPFIEGGCKGEDLEVLGQHLYNLLFTDKPEKHPDTGWETSVRGCFQTAYKNFENDRKNDPRLRLRVILIFLQGADELAGLPWEFIRVPLDTQAFFLAGKKTELILTRCVREAALNDPLDPGQRPLRILIARSAPAGTDDVEANEAIQYIKGLEKPGVVQVDLLENPTYNDLKVKLEEMKPHIFHFIGHGRSNKYELPEVALSRERKDIDKDTDDLSAKDKRDGKKVNEIAWVESSTFAELFKESPPRLVFLHACKGDAVGYKFHSTARDLIKAKIPAVVAMQFEIANADANAFAQKFYEQINAGRSVDDAVSEGRWELGTSSVTRGAWNDRGFGTPVVYLQGQGPLIAPRTPEAFSNEKPAADTSDQLTLCPYDLTHMVRRKASFCAACKKPLAVCPKCNSVITPGFCDNDGPVTEGGSSAVSAAAQVDVSYNQLQPSAPSLPPAEPAGGKSSRIEIRLPQ